MWIKIVEMCFAAGLFVNGLLFIPQVKALLKTKDATGLSATTFLGFNLIQIFAIIHGFLHHDTILMLGCAFTFITCGCVSYLVLRYRRKAVKSIEPAAAV
jgi:MtN3 and saliva related transmembrane protein